MKHLSGSKIPELPANCPNDVILMHDLLSSSSNEFDVEDAGTVMRFGLAMLSTREKSTTLRGSKRMHQRPIKYLVDALRSLGAEINYTERSDYPPLSIDGRKLEGGNIELEASVSSQFISAVLMISPLCKNTVNLTLKNKVVSEPYIKMTIDLMKKFGVEVIEQAGNYIIEPQRYIDIDLPPVLDWSSAAFFYESLALFRSGEIFFHGLFQTGEQGDERLSDIFTELGIRTEEEKDGTRISYHDSLSNKLKVDFTDVPDLFQPVCCAAFGSGCELDISGLHNLHIKESDRLHALKSNLEKFGGLFSFDLPHANLPSISGRYNNEVLGSYDDHRMVMSLAPLSIKFGSIVINGAESVDKSFPAFWKELSSMGFKVVEID